jgi:hypothetical protein
MPSIQDNINAITKRIGAAQKDAAQQQRIPHDLVQCAVFYRSKVIDNLEEPDLLKDVSKLKLFLAKKDFEALHTRMIEWLSSEYFIFPYYSKEIFVSDKDAAIFMPYFINKLIKEQKLPPEVIKDDDINKDLLIVSVAPLTLTFMERTEEGQAGNDVRALV